MRLYYLCGMRKKAALVVLDGWGLGNKSHSDAVYNANTPVTDALTLTYPHATLLTHGANVGLPEGQMGNSEVGHMNIGAGRVVWQMLAKINKAFEDSANGLVDLAKDNVVLNEIFTKAKDKGSLHLLGLLSDGGVHAHINHIISLAKMARKAGVANVYVHGFLDGRDTDPQSGKGFVQQFLNETASDNGIRLSTLVGRYFSMDRDQRWERVKVAYDLLVHGTGECLTDPIAAIHGYYQEGITDEFMKPILLDQSGVGLLMDDSVVLNANFRTDRGRQITRALCLEAFHEQNMHPLKLQYFTLTQYDETFAIAGVVFNNDNLTMTLGEVIANAGLTQLRAAETEKYPHVTFFFSGGREDVFPGELRWMEASPKVATYDLQPEMSAIPLVDNVIRIIKENQPEFVCLNFANPDRVGHTGVYEAIIKAVETVDACLGKLIGVCTDLDYEMIIIADHGNADFAENADGSPNTAHSTNPVPIWWVTEEVSADINSGRLADVAPSILEIMGLNQPALMTGKSLLIGI